MGQVGEEWDDLFCTINSYLPIGNRGIDTLARGVVLSPLMVNAKSALKRAFSEVTTNPPKVLASTRKKSGAKQAGKQKVAIALSKARASGAKIPYAGVKRG